MHFGVHINKVTIGGYKALVYCINNSIRLDNKYILLSANIFLI